MTKTNPEKDLDFIDAPKDFPTNALTDENLKSLEENMPKQ